MARKKQPKLSAPTEEERTCPQCDKLFKTTQILRMHKTREHGNQFFPCDKCTKSFKTRYYLKGHKIRVHSEVVFAKCDRCDKSFKTKDSYNTHMIQVHTDGMFVCNDCGKCFKSKWYLLKHIQTVHCDLRFVCTKCKRYVKTKIFLQAHYDTYHKGILIDNTSFAEIKIIETFKCELCSRQFDSEKLLNNHTNRCRSIKMSVKTRSRNRHVEEDNEDVNVKSEPESDNSIDIADVEFEFKSVNAENIAHTDRQIFICDYCEKNIKYLHNLRKHIRTFHSVVRYPCNICKMNMNSHNSLREHYEAVHSGSIINKNSYKTIKICKVTKTNNLIAKNFTAHTKSLKEDTNNPANIPIIPEKHLMNFDDIDLELKKEFGIDEAELHMQYNMCSYFTPKKEIKSEVEDNCDIDVGPVIVQRPDIDQYDNTEFVAY